jgi:hypothetical protein
VASKNPRFGVIHNGLDTHLLIIKIQSPRKVQKSEGWGVNSIIASLGFRTGENNKLEVKK